MKYLYLLSLLIFPKLFGQVGIGVEDPQALLDVESMLIDGQLINPNPNGAENTYYQILNNGYPGWDNLPQPVDFSGSVMIKDKHILESTNGLLLNNTSNTNAETENNNISNSWRIIDGLKTSVTFDLPNGSISTQFQTLVLKYTRTGESLNNRASYQCGIFVRKTPTSNPNSTTGYKLKVIRPEVLIGGRNAYKIMSVSGLITNDGIDQNFVINQSYDIAVACRGRNIDSNEYLRIGRGISNDNSNTYNATTQALLTPANIKSTFIVEQYQTP